MTAFTCRECGASERPRSWSNGAELEAAALCFGCHYWHEAIALAGDPRSVRLNGVHRFIGDGQGSSRGHYGARFVVEFLDGRTVTTADLWHQGEIPARFRDRLPDNARAVRHA